MKLLLLWPRPVPGELLSCYLSRSAISRGMSAESLMSLVSPGSPVWTRDVDVCASPKLVADVASASRLSEKAIYGMTLHKWVRATSRGAHIQGLHHWITGVGVYHRSRRRYGLSFCPMCLVTDGGFRKKGRLAFWTVCPLHKVMLQDACPGCDAPIQAHRQGFDVTRCCRCGKGLASGGVQETVCTSLQGLLFNALVNPEDQIEIGIFQARGSELLWGLDAMLSAFHASRAANPGAEREKRARLELRRVQERHRDMQLIEELCFSGLDALLVRAKSEGVTQKSFRGAVPNWLTEVVVRLAVGRGNDAADLNTATIRVVAKAQRRRLEGWREMRADLLLKMIGR